MDYSNCCRSCLCPNKYSVILLTVFEVRSLYEDCTGIKVDKEDSLPKFLCFNCYEKCKNWKKFQENCKQNEDLLHCSFIEGKFTLKPEIDFLNVDIKEELKSDDDGLDLLPTQSEISDLKSIILNMTCKVKLEDIEKSPEIPSELVTTNRVVIEDESIKPLIKPAQVKIQLCNPEIILLAPRNKSSQQIINSETVKLNCDNIGIEMKVTKEYDGNIKLTFINSFCKEAAIVDPEIIKTSTIQTPKRIIVKRTATEATKQRAPIDEIITPQHFCKDCDRKFTTEAQLKRHAKAHLIFTCEQCVDSRVFLNKTSLYSHIKHVHSKEKYSHLCNNCGKLFLFKHLLDKHIKQVHLKELNFVCKTCGKRYVSSSRLSIHSKVHTLDKPFICHICPEAYKNKQKLKHHITSHTGEKNYKCSYCERCFRNNDTLRDHRMIHTGERPNVCKICDRGFIQKIALKKHMLTHRAV